MLTSLKIAAETSAKITFPRAPKRMKLSLMNRRGITRSHRSELLVHLLLGHASGVNGLSKTLSKEVCEANAIDHQIAGDATDDEQGNNGKEHVGSFGDLFECLARRKPYAGHTADETSPAFIR